MRADVLSSYYPTDNSDSRLLTRVVEQDKNLSLKTTPASDCAGFLTVITSQGGTVTRRIFGDNFTAQIYCLV